MKKIMMICLMSLMVASAQAQCPGNLIVNGDFESGNTGFSSDYTYTAPGYDALWPEAYYTVYTNTNDAGWVHHLWTDYGDHTTGSELMLIVNGAEFVTEGSEPNVWGQDVTVEENRTYVLTYYLRTCYPAAPARLRCSINGSQVGPDANAPDTPGEGWLEVSYDWASGSNTLAEIRLLDLNYEHTGNDFTIDDICFVVTLITADIDIKPGSCPNPFNPKSKGSVPVAIVGTDSFNVTDVNVASLMLEGVPILPDNVLTADVTQPDGDAADCYNCFDEDDPANFNCDLDPCIPGNDAYCGDGYDDLIVKFDTGALAAAIASMGGADPEDCVELTLTGETLAGVPIVGSDSVRILKKIRPAGP